MVKDRRPAPFPTERTTTMPQYAALIYSKDVDWTQPEHASEMEGYGEFGQAAAAVLRGGNALYPTTTATTGSALVVIHCIGGGDQIASRAGPALVEVSVKRRHRTSSATRAEDANYAKVAAVSVKQVPKRAITARRSRR